MTTQTNIEQRVMASVGVVYTARKAFGATALKAYVLVAALLAIWKLVWVTRIEQNFLQIMHGGVVAVWNYSVYALLHTHLAVQVSLAIAAVAFVMLGADVVRSAASPKQQFSF